MSKSDCIEHIARISMGKDSLKMLDVIHTRGLPLDRITTTDVWATETVPAWLPPMQQFRDRMDQWIWEKYHIECEHLCARNPDGSKRTYEQMFYHIPVRRSQTVQVERERERLQPGSIRGFPDLWNKWCQSDLKRNAYGTHQRMATVKRNPYMVSKAQIQGGDPKDFRHKYQLVQETQDRLCQNPFSQCPPRRAKRNIVEYLGIAADEPDRFGQLNDQKRAPLVEFGIYEDLCGLYCQYNDILAPSYETSCRDGCWFCHNQGVDQLRNLWKNYPDYWALLMKWDLDSPVTFKADGHTVHDFDFRFRLEAERKIPTDRTFRWSMLENPPKFVAYRGEQITLPMF